MIERKKQPDELLVKIRFRTAQEGGVNFGLTVKDYFTYGDTEDTVYWQNKDWWTFWLGYYTEYGIPHRRHNPAKIDLISPRLSWSGSEGLYIVRPQAPFLWTHIRKDSIIEVLYGMSQYEYVHVVEAFDNQYIANLDKGLSAEESELRDKLRKQSKMSPYLLEVKFDDQN